MKIAVVGLGSMGKRRIRLLCDYLAREDLQDSQVIGIDTNKERREAVSGEFGIEVFESLQSVGACCDAVIVSTSPVSHANIITEALQLGSNVFTEINLVSDGYERNIELAKAANKVLFLSSTFLYREEVSYIINEVSGQTSGLYNYHVGQYLPDWHPWEDYRDFFASNARTDACRELFAIELPWLREAFGEIVDVHALSRKVSDLDVPFDDSYLVLIEHESGIVGSLQVDVVSRKAVRNFEFCNEELYLSWDGSPSGLKKLDLETKQLESIDSYASEAQQRSDYASFVVENAYYNELAAFFDTITQGIEPRYGFEEDLSVLKVIDRIEKAK